jgi:hypothetical protein
MRFSFKKLFFFCCNSKVKVDVEVSFDDEEIVKVIKDDGEIEFYSSEEE